MAIVVFVLTAMHASGQILREDIGLSDPAILADPVTHKYYMTGTGGGLWVSADLETWTGPTGVIATDGSAWMGATPEIWAAEIHRVDGKYYNFATLTNKSVQIDDAGHPRRAVHLLRSNLPDGTYRLIPGADDTYLPATKTTLDGSLFTDTDGTRYLIYCHEWIQNGNGTVEAIRLKDDMSGTEGQPTVLFRAHNATWNTGDVTDGPFLFRTQTGRLGCLWTSWHGDRYVQGVAYSTTGQLKGPWRQEPLPITPDNYGHGMLFRTFEGQLLLSIHSHRNIDLDRQWFERHPVLFLMDDSGESLRCVMRYQREVGPATPAEVVVNNPEFEYGKLGWTCTTKAQNQLIAHNQGGAITGNFFESWDANSYVGEIYQELDRLPAGTYRISAAAFRNSVISGGQDGAPAVKLFAGDDATLVTTNDPERYAVVTHVGDDGRLRFGLRSEQKNYKWMGIDNVRIEYFGPGTYSADDIDRAQRNASIYLRSCRDGRYLNAGQSWGTQAVLSDHPLDLRLVSLPNGRYAIDSRIDNGGGNHFAGANGYLDGSVTPFYINGLEQRRVTLSTDGSHYWGNTGGKVVSTQLSNSTSDAAQWDVLTFDDLMVSLSAATAEAPADATFLISCPDFGRNDTRISAWQGATLTRGGAVTNQCAEAPAGPFDVSQTISGLPDGTYEVSVQGFSRGASAQFYAGDVIRPLMDIADESGTQPTTLDAASTRFTAGRYDQSLRVSVKGGSLRLGLRRTADNTDAWTVFDNFRLTYLGKAAEPTYTIDPSQVRQHFTGWGVSLCWWANMCGRWSGANINRLVDWLVSPTGLNYSLFRYNIGGGDDPQWRHCKEHHMADGMGIRAEMPGFKDFSGDDYHWDRDEAQRKIMLRIKEKRPDAVFEAFSNSAPYYMTYSGCVSGNTDGGKDNLKPAYYKEFAHYLVDVCKHYKDEYGLEFRTLEPFNEAETDFWHAGGAQEGCHFDVASQVKFLRVLAPILKESGLSTIISASDETKVAQSVTDLQEYQRSGVLPLVGQWNTHTYAVTNADRMRLSELAREAGLPLWMSEVGAGGNGLAGNLALAQKLIDDMRYLQPEAWIDWQVMEEWNDQWCTVTGNFANQTFSRNKNYYVRQQCTRFIRGGYDIIATDCEQTLCAMNAARDTLVIVMLNEGDRTTHHIDLSLFRDLPAKTTIKAWRTSQSENLARIYNFNINNDVLSVTLPAQSITTIVVPFPSGENRIHDIGADALHHTNNRQTACFDMGGRPLSPASKTKVVIRNGQKRIQQR